MKIPTLLTLVACGSLMGVNALAQPAPATPPSTSGYVTREEYEKLKSEMEAMRREMKGNKDTAATKEEVDQTVEDIQKDIKANHNLVSDLGLGTSKFMITGYAFSGYTDRKGENSSFNAGISPIFLWTISDRVFVEAETELGLSNSDTGDGATDVNLEYADINYILNPYMTVRAGKFLTPFGQFPERLHPAWINKLPDFPLVFAEDDGLVPFSQVGFELRGAVPVQSTKFDYAVYLSNGSRLITDDSEAAGRLIFDNNVDNNDNKAIGGRVGFLPIPQFEIGYSFQAAEVGSGEFSGTNALLQGVDMSYIRDSELLKGVIDLRAEWVWSSVDKTTFDSNGSLGFGPVTFDNKRNGGYVQLAYQPTKVGGWISKLEGVCRYDRIDVPNDAPGSFDEQRVTFGLNYWLGPSTVLKTAYQFDDSDVGGHRNAFLIQAAVGF